MSVKNKLGRSSDYINPVWVSSEKDTDSISSVTKDEKPSHIGRSFDYLYPAWGEENGRSTEKEKVKDVLDRKKFQFRCYCTWTQTCSVCKE